MGDFTLAPLNWPLRFLSSKKLRFEDQIESFPSSFQHVTSGKILSLLKTQETPIIGVVPY